MDGLLSGGGGLSLKWDLVSEKLVLIVICFSRKDPAVTAKQQLNSKHPTNKDG